MNSSQRVEELEMGHRKRRRRPQLVVGGLLLSFILLLCFRVMWELQSFATTRAMENDDLALVAPLQKVGQTMNITKVGIVVVADRVVQARQGPLHETIRSYAAVHGYEFYILEPSVSCLQVLQNFFFLKHCTVREFLSKQSPGYTLFVLDGDVIVVAPEVSLSRWIERDTDVLLYEREWNFEIMAGNYMVRNTQFALFFLLLWEQFDYRARSITGYHSFDNGAIHLVVLQVLDIPVEDYTECDRKYQMLTSDDKQLDEYYSFVACTRRALGPNRRWNVRGPGVLTVAHRYHGFVVDHYAMNRRPGGGIPFYHGEKNPAEALKHYKEAKPWKSMEEQSLAIDDKYWISSTATEFNSSVPRINLSACIRNFSCEPASMNGKPRRDLYRNHNETLIFEYNNIY